jgi:NAD(P)-dependent dehydrogenase (short-subunit alcohol dehydrogenase family)
LVLVFDDFAIRTAFLAHEASRFITGETLQVDGG